MMENTYWMPCILSSDVNCKTNTGVTNVKLSWAEGMIGALPVFKTKAAAEAYAKANGGAVITEIASAPPATK